MRPLLPGRCYGEGPQQEGTENRALASGTRDEGAADLGAALKAAGVQTGDVPGLSSHDRFVASPEESRGSGRST
jgi:hypothetical protein